MLLVGLENSDKFFTILISGAHEGKERLTHYCMCSQMFKVTPLTGTPAISLLYKWFTISQSRPHH